MKKEPNKEKQKMYEDTIKRLRLAINHEFYFEAIMIEYALVEDRFRDILNNCGIVNFDLDNKLKVTNKAKKPLRELLKLKPNDKFNISNIKTKIEIMRNLRSGYVGDDKFFLAISKKVQQDKNDVNALLSSIEEWTEKRNVLVHNLMNQKATDIGLVVSDLAQKGFALFRELDNIEGRLTTENFRKKYRVQ